MLVKEYRIPLPLTSDDYRIAQLYMIAKKSREESYGTGSGIEILTNEPYTDGPGPNGIGQYTRKVYHIGSHLPAWVKSLIPKSALSVEEEAWNAYPYTKTRFTCPFVEKFNIEIETFYFDDGGHQENVFNLSVSELKLREVDVIDIVKDQIYGPQYKEEEDPTLFVSQKTCRGPLHENWIEEYWSECKGHRTPLENGKAIMCAYKLCKVEFRYWGMQSKIERFIHDSALRKTMLHAHTQAWAWQDEWWGLSIEDIRCIEKDTQEILAKKYKNIDDFDFVDEISEDSHENRSSGKPKEEVSENGGEEISSGVLRQGLSQGNGGFKYSSYVSGEVYSYRKQGISAENKENIHFFSSDYSSRSENRNIVEKYEPEARCSPGKSIEYSLEKTPKSNDIQTHLVKENSLQNKGPKSIKFSSRESGKWADQQSGNFHDSKSSKSRGSYKSSPRNSYSKNLSYGANKDWINISHVQWRMESIRSDSISSDDDDEFFDCRGTKLPCQFCAWQRKNKYLTADVEVSSLNKWSSLEIIPKEEEMLYQCGKNSEQSQFSPSHLTRTRRCVDATSYSPQSPTKHVCPSSPMKQNTCPTSVLLMVVHGGSVLDYSADITNKKSDIATFRGTIETVIRQHYPHLVGRVCVKLVPTKPLCASSLSVFSSLSPMGLSYPNSVNGHGEQPQVPIAALPILGSLSSEYKSIVDQLVKDLNMTWEQFLLSEEGNNFNGEIFLLGDSLGGIVCYDSLIRGSNHVTAGQYEQEDFRQTISNPFKIDFNQALPYTQPLLSNPNSMTLCNDSSTSLDTFLKRAFDWNFTRHQLSLKFDRSSSPSIKISKVDSKKSNWLPKILRKESLSKLFPRSCPVTPESALNPPKITVRKSSDPLSSRGNSLLHPQCFRKKSAPTSLANSSDSNISSHPPTIYSENLLNFENEFHKENFNTPRLNSQYFPSSGNSEEKFDSQSQAFFIKSHPSSVESQPFSVQSHSSYNQHQPISIQSSNASAEVQLLSNSCPISAQKQPISDSFQPDSRETEFISTKSQPLSKETKFLSEISQPISKETKLLSEISQPISKETKLMPEITQPIQARSQNESHCISTSNSVDTPSFLSNSNFETQLPDKLTQVDINLPDRLTSNTQNYTPDRDTVTMNERSPISSLPLFDSFYAYEAQRSKVYDDTKHATHKKPSLSDIQKHSEEGKSFGRSFSAPSRESGESGLEFDVSSLFLFGCPIGIVLTYRQIICAKENAKNSQNKECFDRPFCDQVYNLFHPTDPIAVRLEPLLTPRFAFVRPVTVPRYTQFPLGDGTPTQLGSAIQANLEIFQQEINADENSQSNADPIKIHEILSKLRWWGSNRLDFALYCPEGLANFPSNVLPHLFHASYWESLDVAAFVIRQIMGGDPITAMDEYAESRDFMQIKPREKWRKKKTSVKIKNVGANHRGNDVIVAENSQQTVEARFMYGPLDVVALTGEKVDVYIRDANSDWKLLGTEISDKNGRISVHIPDHLRLGIGINPVKFIVRGDHSSCSLNLAVLPPRTDCVVFSIDGSFTASMSVSGRDPKVRAGAVDVVRHWHELGYLIIYITGRPDMQQQKVVTWLAQHNFPFGLVSFVCGLSTDPLGHKADYLRTIIKDCQVVIQAAYGSAKDIGVYASVGLNPQKIYIVGKSSKKHATHAQVLADGYAAHLSTLSSLGTTHHVRVNQVFTLPKGSFSLPGRGGAGRGRNAARRTSSFPVIRSISHSG